METWNREELYAEVWDQPLVKVAPKYGISAASNRMRSAELGTQ